MSYRRIRQISGLAVAVALAALGAGLVGEAVQERHEMVRKASAMTGGDPWAGQAALERYGCGSCHTIPGVQRAIGLVGPPLGGFAKRVYLAGILANKPDALVSWLKDPPAIDPLTAMPNTGVTDEDARHIAAFLYTLD